MEQRQTAPAPVQSEAEGPAGNGAVVPSLAPVPDPAVVALPPEVPGSASSWANEIPERAPPPGPPEAPAPVVEIAASRVPEIAPMPEPQPEPQPEEASALEPERPPASEPEEEIIASWAPELVPPRGPGSKPSPAPMLDPEEPTPSLQLRSLMTPVEPVREPVMAPAAALLRGPLIAPSHCSGCSVQKTDAPRCEHCGAALRAGGYVVLRTISQGPHGRVYEALGPSGKRVALKELIFSLVPSTTTLDAFDREAELLRTISHAQIPRLLDAFSEGVGVNTRLYLAQEFVEGEPLLDSIEREPLSELETRRLAKQVLRVLIALHGRDPPVLHRDIKPANLILRPDGLVSLVDFGSARLLARDVTHGATLVGTFGYMPPEQLGGTVDASCDLYALGATLLHGLTGLRPEDMTRDGLALDVSYHLKGVDPALRRAIKRLLEPDRADRFQSADEALEAFLPAAARPISRRAMAVGALLAIAIGAAAGALFPPEAAESEPETELPAPPVDPKTYFSPPYRPAPRPRFVPQRMSPGFNQPVWSTTVTHVPGRGVRFMPNTGGIAILTQPPGARVMVNGTLLPNLTPITLTGPLAYSSGNHQVKVIHSGVVNQISELEVRPGTITLVEAKLRDGPIPSEELKAEEERWWRQSAPRGLLAGSTMEAGLEVLVDGHRTGRVTPLPVAAPLELEPGPHIITFRRGDGTLVSRRIVNITAGEMTTLRNVPAD